MKMVSSATVRRTANGCAAGSTRVTGLRHRDAELYSKGGIGEEKYDCDSGA